MKRTNFFAWIFSALFLVSLALVGCGKEERVQLPNGSIGIVKSGSSIEIPSFDNGKYLDVVVLNRGLQDSFVQKLKSLLQEYGEVNAQPVVGSSILRVETSRELTLSGSDNSISMVASVRDKETRKLWEAKFVDGQWTVVVG